MMQQHNANEVAGQLGQPQEVVGHAVESPPSTAAISPSQAFVPTARHGGSTSTASASTANPVDTPSVAQPASDIDRRFEDLYKMVYQSAQGASDNCRTLMKRVKNLEAVVDECKKQRVDEYSAYSVRDDEEENRERQAVSGGGASLGQGVARYPRDAAPLPSMPVWGEDRQIEQQRQPPARALDRRGARASPERETRVYARRDYSLDRAGQSAAVARGARPVERQDARLDYSTARAGQSAAVDRGAGPVERQDGHRLDPLEVSRVAWRQEDDDRRVARDRRPPPPEEQYDEYEEQPSYYGHHPQHLEDVTRPPPARRATVAHVQPQERHGSPPRYYEDVPRGGTKRKERGPGKCSDCGGSKVQCRGAIKYVHGRKYSQHQGLPCVANGGCLGCNLCLFEWRP